MPYVHSAPNYAEYSHSDERRAELGHDRLNLRPPTPTSKTLDALAKKLNGTRSLAVAYAVAKALEALETATPEELLEAKREMQDLNERVGAR